MADYSRKPDEQHSYVPSLRRHRLLGREDANLEPKGLARLRGGLHDAANGVLPSPSSAK